MIRQPAKIGPVRLDHEDVDVVDPGLGRRPREDHFLSVGGEHRVGLGARRLFRQLDRWTAAVIRHQVDEAAAAGGRPSPRKPASGRPVRRRRRRTVPSRVQHPQHLAIEPDDLQVRLACGIDALDREQVGVNRVPGGPVGCDAAGRGCRETADGYRSRRPPSPAITVVVVLGGQYTMLPRSGDRIGPLSWAGSVVSACQHGAGRGVDEVRGRDCRSAISGRPIDWPATEPNSAGGTRRPARAASSTRPCWMQPELDAPHCAEPEDCRLFGDSAGVDVELFTVVPTGVPATVLSPRRAPP